MNAVDGKRGAELPGGGVGRAGGIDQHDAAVLAAAGEAKLAIGAAVREPHATPGTEASTLAQERNELNHLYKLLVNLAPSGHPRVNRRDGEP